MDENPMGQIVVSWLICSGRFRVHAINAVGGRSGRIIEIEDIDARVAELERVAEQKSGG